MSLGGPQDVPELHDAIKKAVDSDISVVVAAGYSGTSQETQFEYDYPGSYDEVIEVGAVDFDLKIASFSDKNPEVDIVAPGVNILSTYPKSTYATISGTSMATPHVSGSLALLINLAEKEFERHLTEAEIYAQLVKRTLPLGHSKPAEGNGLVMLDLMTTLRQVVKSANFDYQLA